MQRMKVCWRKSAWKREFGALYEVGQKQRGARKQRPGASGMALMLGKADSDATWESPALSREAAIHQSGIVITLPLHRMCPLSLSLDS